MQAGKAIRLRRLFGKGRAVVVAVDHGLSLGPLPGIEDPLPLIQMVAQTEADAILASPALVERAAEVMGGLGCVIRVDNSFTVAGPDLTHNLLTTTLERAVQVGADAICAMAHIGCEREAALMQKIGMLASECSRWGIPLIAEMIPGGAMEYHMRGYAGASASHLTREAIELEGVRLACRVGAELGADVVKTHYTGTVDGFRRVTGSCLVPVLVAGGPKTQSDAEFLAMVAEAMEGGGAGIAMGRNLWQHPDPKAMLQALCSIVHQGASPAQALRILEG